MRYYFHVVTDARFIRDPDGGEFAGLDEAEAEATQSARDLMAAELNRGRPIPSGWRILIAAEDDAVLKSLSFSVLANGTSGSSLARASALQSPSPALHAQTAIKRRSFVETERLVERARVHVEAQRARIAVLERDRRDASLAKAVLSQLEKTFECMILAETIIKQLP